MTVFQWKFTLNTKLTSNTFGKVTAWGLTDRGYIPCRAHLSSSPRPDVPWGPPSLFVTPFASYRCDRKTFGTSGPHTALHTYRRRTQEAEIMKKRFLRNNPVDQKWNHVPVIEREVTVRYLFDAIKRTELGSRDECHEMQNDCAFNLLIKISASNYNFKRQLRSRGTNFAY
jgi:hypothetical protein